MAYKDKEKQKEFQRLWSRKKHLANKLKAIELCGSSCVKCGNSDHRCLQFDHIKPELRTWGNHSASNNVGKILNGTLKLVDIQLLCANCHSIKTYEEDRKTFKNYING